MKKWVTVILTCGLLFVLSGSLALTISDLPNPVDCSRSVDAPSFSMTGIGGNTITSTNYGAGKYLLLVYGRINCWNTRSFISGIKSAMSLLKDHGVTVLVSLWDDPSDEEMTEFSDLCPGIVCGKASTYESGLWTGLEVWTGENVSTVTFPGVFLRDKDGRLRFCSTGYVEEPLAVVAGAIAMTGANMSTERIPGDVNRDGSIDALDFLMIKMYMMEWEFTGMDEINADVNADGIVSALDYVLIKQYVMGLPVELKSREE